MGSIEQGPGGDAVRDVLGLHVAVHDASRVRPAEHSADLSRNAHRAQRRAPIPAMTPEQFEARMSAVAPYCTPQQLAIACSLVEGMAASSGASERARRDREGREREKQFELEQLGDEAGRRRRDSEPA